MVHPLETSISEAMTYQQYLSRSYFSELDGIRGLAVLLVIACHVKGTLFQSLSGHYGVTLFFVLSGFLITTLCLREEAKYGKVTLLGFYVRRSCRIFPLYFLVLAIHAVFLFGFHLKAEHETLFRLYWPGYVLYYQEFIREWTGARMPFVQSWSLGVEEKFYLVWPILAFGTMRRGMTKSRVLVALAGALAFGAIPYVLAKSEYSSLGRCMEPYAGILAGCVLALALHHSATYEWIRQHCGSLTCIMLTSIVFAVQLTAWWAASAGIARVWHGLFIAATTVWLASLLVGAGGIVRLFQNQALTFIGRMSYGMYLIHIMVLFPVHRIAASIPSDAAAAFFAFVVATSISLLVAYFLSLAIEQPFIRLGRRFAESLRATEHVAVPSAAI